MDKIRNIIDFMGFSESTRVALRELFSKFWKKGLVDDVRVRY